MGKANAMLSQPKTDLMRPQIGVIKIPEDATAALDTSPAMASSAQFVSELAMAMSLASKLVIILISPSSLAHEAAVAILFVTRSLVILGRVHVWVLNHAISALQTLVSRPVKPILPASRAPAPSVIGPAPPFIAAKIILHPLVLDLVIHLWHVMQTGVIFPTTPVMVTVFVSKITAICSVHIRRRICGVLIWTVNETIAVWKAMKGSLWNRKVGLEAQRPAPRKR